MTSAPAAPSPLLSVVTLVPAAAPGAIDSLLSLSLRRQQDVSASDYELVVLAPESAAPELASTNLGPNVRYAPFAGEAPLVAALAAVPCSRRSSLLGFVEGLPRVTPRAIQLALSAARLSEHPLVALPAYAIDAEALATSPADPYALFDGATFDPLNPHGYLAGLVESTSFFCTRADAEAALHRSRRGTPLNLRALFGRLLVAPDARLLVLGGEGAFHPSSAARVARNPWSLTERQPLLVGPMPGRTQSALGRSLTAAALHAAITSEAGRPEWPMDLPRVAAAGRSKGPLLSIVVVTYRLSRQLENTLHSLSARHQWNVAEDDYEIIVVENRSDAVFGEARARSFGSNVRYFLRDEPGISPAPSMNFGARQARGQVVGLMIDAARMVTPRVVEYALMAQRLHHRSLVAVPGYHLGPGRQHLTSLDGYDEAEEERLLASIDWKSSGYRLFEIGCLDEATQGGFLSPMLEATCLFCPRACLDEVEGLDERFDLEGGGEVNHDLFARLCRLPDTRYVVLWGEGSFHQFHGGVSTRSAEDREAKLETFRQQHDRIRGHRYRTFEREPWLLGTYPGAGQLRFQEAIGLGKLRYSMVCEEGRAEWPND